MLPWRSSSGKSASGSIWTLIASITQRTPLTATVSQTKIGAHDAAKGAFARIRAVHPG
jgi:hypothetical protein